MDDDKGAYATTCETTSARTLSIDTEHGVTHKVQNHEIDPQEHDCRIILTFE